MPVQSIIKRGLDTFKQAMKSYDKSLLKPPKQEMAWQQVSIIPNNESWLFHHSYSRCLLLPIVLNL